MRQRIILFFVLLTLGVTTGLAYGWVVNPKERAEGSLSTLRVDYKTDSVLMIATVYTENKDIEWAVTRLSWLTSENPGNLVQRSIDFAEQNGYQTEDIAALYTLAAGLASWSSP